MCQGNDVGSQYRSAIFARTDAQLKAAETSRAAYQQIPTPGHGPITTEITRAPDHYYAEPHHQQYLSANKTPAATAESAAQASPAR